jgi:phosphopantetheinyl transferase
VRIYCAPRCGESGSAAVYALLEHAFRAEYGGDLPEITKTPNGKPYFPMRQDIHFSLSHARTHVLCAISPFPVGADIESPREISQRAIRYYSSPDELEQFDPLELWVLKESYIKLIGGTLPTVKKITFSREAGLITSSDKTVTSKLYNIEKCHAAVSYHNGTAPESIELINGSVAREQGSSWQAP